MYRHLMHLSSSLVLSLRIYVVDYNFFSENTSLSLCIVVCIAVLIAFDTVRITTFDIDANTTIGLSMNTITANTVPTESYN